MSKVEVNQISSQCGSTLTIGQSGDTVTLACGATQSGFGRTGTVDWDTTAKTASFTAVSGNGYFVNTTSGAITLTLPASPSAGDIVAFKDYAFTFATNNLTVDGNGSPIGGVDGTINPTYDTNGTSKTFIYVDGTKGWLVTNESTDTSQESNAQYIVATGGTITCCGDFKIHTFTGPGTFCVSCAGNCAGSNTVDYLVVAGGGGAGFNYAAGGGAGGFRESHSVPVSGCYTASPLATPTALPVSATGYPITVGAGGPGGPPTTSSRACSGSNSVFSTITSAGGGGGGAGGSPSPVSDGNGRDGGSGGGAGGYGPGTRGGGCGNQPPVSPPQGNNGGPATAPGSGYASAGGGGATAVGGSPDAPTNPAVDDAAGGAGAGTNINPATGVSGPGCLQYYAGGGGGGVYAPALPTTATNAGGIGGGGNGSREISTPVPAPSHNGTVNTGGGAGGGGTSPGGYGGGSGIVIIRYKFQ
jgi:hypothetical protein